MPSAAPAAAPSPAPAPGPVLSSAFISIEGVLVPEIIDNEQVGASVWHVLLWRHVPVVVGEGGRCASFSRAALFLNPFFCPHAHHP